MSERKNRERTLRLAVLLVAALVLGACAESPRTELSWNVRDYRSRTHQPAPLDRNTYYGPQSVSLPPVQKYGAPAYDTPVKRQASVPVPTPRPIPAWYNPSPAPAAPNPDSGAFASEGPVHFSWPLAGRIVLDFGADGNGERNDGINIAAAPGTLVHAAAAGTVKYCGNELRGYGNLVLIQHDDGYMTAYAHVGNILVSRDARVAAGQAIATSGASGDVSFPQLHFEIRHDKRPIDPKLLLPKGVASARIARGES